MTDLEMLLALRQEFNRYRSILPGRVPFLCIRATLVSWDCKDLVQDLLDADDINKDGEGFGDFDTYSVPVLIERRRLWLNAKIEQAPVFEALDSAKDNGYIVFLLQDADTIADDLLELDTDVDGFHRDSIIEAVKIWQAKN